MGWIVGLFGLIVATFGAWLGRTWEPAVAAFFAGVVLRDCMWLHMGHRWERLS